MKKFIALLVSSVMAVSLAACGGSSNNQPAGDVAQTAADTAANDGTAAEVSGGRLAAIKEAGVLKIATSPDYPPYEFEDLSKNGQDKYVGADIELAKYIADKLGVDLEINAMAFDACLAAVGQGRVDITICGMVPKEERRTAMDFTNVYYNDGNQVIVTLEDLAGQYQSLEDFAGKKVAAQNGTLQYDLVTTQLSDSECEIITAVPDGIMMLKTGKVDAIALASVTADNYVANYPELVICEPKFEYESMGVVAGVVKNEPELIDALNEIIDEVLESQVYYQWIEEASALSNQVQGQ
ncbi:MAG: transporter substrate-binding domain-containing protein [Lachnospiraceae bacterium]